MTITTMKTYPKHVTPGRRGTPVTIKPLEASDAHELLEFFLRVPEEDRFYLKEDVTSPEVIENWTRHIDYNRVFPMVALAEGKIIADATLHRNRATARRHVGEIRIVVAPGFRNQGVGALMMRELIDIASDNGLDSVMVEFVEEKEESAIRVARRLGFDKVAAIPNTVRDMDGKLHNLAIMQLTLVDWLERW